MYPLTKGSLESNASELTYSTDKIEGWEELWEVAHSFTPKQEQLSQTQAANPISSSCWIFGEAYNKLPSNCEGQQH